jgi:hypothetical protein
MLGTLFLWMLVFHNPDHGLLYTYPFTHPDTCAELRRALLKWSETYAPNAQISPCDPFKVVASEWLQPSPGLHKALDR